MVMFYEDAGASVFAFNAERWNDISTRRVATSERYIFIVVLFLLSACASQQQTHQSQSSFTGEQAVYVINHGWHTGFIVPAKTIQTYLPKLQARFPDTAYLEFGWGDKGFYQNNEITTGLTLRAMFWSAGSVIHAVAVPENITEYFSHSNIEKLCLSEQAYIALIRFIADSFGKDSNGEIIALKSGIYGDSQFYQGAGNYHIFNTCNTWLAKGLASTGMDIYPAFKLTAGSVMNYVLDYKQNFYKDAGASSLCVQRGALQR